ncbi:MAG TPA: selenocysteine-specific translation elongation factor [Solirubrobacteraceae bacterium]|jgi:selenocysteine-specific elongation factor
MSGEPLTLGTAGHVDHGKTTLVAALTGVDTDRLPEEKARGLTIALGYAPLTLPSGTRISLVDVPGHERFVRTMVAGATGIDLYLMVIAADDGVMPQTVEHAAVLRALGVRAGVVAVTKADLADPARASGEAAELLPGAPVVACSARTGSGLEQLLKALGEAASSVTGRGAAPGAALLHIDRVFTVRGRGTVVTGTLWSGSVAAGDTLASLPSDLRVRVRGVEVHGEPTERALSGQRVAVNLAGVRPELLAPGDVLAEPGAVAESRVLDCALELRDAEHGMRVQVHHGTRSVAGRLAELGGALWQLRLERPVLARRGDRLVVRRLAPPDTLGGGEVLDPSAARHGRREDVLARLRAIRAGADLPPAAGERSATRAHGAKGQQAGTVRPSAAAPQEIGEQGERDLAELEQRLIEADTSLLSEAQIGEQARLLGELRERGRAVRVSGRLYAHAAVLARVHADVLALLAAEGSVTLAGVRDALGLSRKAAQAFLEHLDALRVTRRLPDDSRVLSRAPGAQRSERDAQRERVT